MKIKLLLTALAVVALTSCVAGRGTMVSVAGDTITRHAGLLTLVDAGEYRVADILNPWDTTEVLQRLVIFPEGTELPPDAPQGVMVETPLSKTVVMSSVHLGAIGELGATNAVKGVADASYIKMPEIVEGLKAGSIADVGSSMSPTLEKIVMANPDAVLYIPYEGRTSLELKGTRSNEIAMADWMEGSPLGRAEWMLLLGELYGEPVKARNIFDQVVREYGNIARDASTAEGSPLVLTEKSTDGVWYVPGGESYMAKLIEDAGGTYVWHDDTSSGSVPLSLEQVFDSASQADVWLIKTYGYDLTLDNLASENPLYKEIKAYKDSNVYGVDTSSSMLFEEFPFHPERLLLDYYLMFHPDTPGQLRYYRHAR